MDGKWTFKQIWKLLALPAAKQLILIHWIIIVGCIYVIIKQNGKIDEAQLKREVAEQICEQQIQAAKAKDADVWGPILDRFIKDNQSQAREMDSLNNEIRKLITKMNKEIKTFR